MGIISIGSRLKLGKMLLAISLVGLLMAVRADAVELDRYTLAVVPQFTPNEIYRKWTPVVEKLNRVTGKRFEIKIFANILSFEAAFLNGEIDLAFLNPYHAVMAKRAQGYLPLVRDDANLLTGILVVQRNSPIKSLQELNGKTLAFPSPNAFGASLYIRALLAEQEKISFTALYVKTHSNTYRHVILGEVAAGGGVNNTIKRESKEVQAELRVLYETPGVPSHPLVAHPRIPAATQELITQVILDMSKESDGQKILLEIQLPQPVKADYNRDYKRVEKLKLEKYSVIEAE
jgi:phosphonate transport system substrate-binding protein